MTRAVIWKRKGCPPCERVVREIVPVLKMRGVEVEIKDAHDHPCEAMRDGIDVFPTIVADTPTGRVTVRGYPPDAAVSEIIGG